MSSEQSSNQIEKTISKLVSYCCYGKKNLIMKKLNYTNTYAYELKHK